MNKSKFDDNENDPQRVKEIAEYCWWKFRWPKWIAEEFNLTVAQVDKIRETAKYRNYVLRLMISQRAPENFDRWVDEYHSTDGDMRKFARRMGLKPEVIPTLVERAREAHAKIAAEEMRSPEAIADPYQRRENYKHTLYREQGRKCKRCQLQFDFRDFEMDHIVPSSRGGTDDLQNFQLLCRSCNRSKGNRTEEEWKGVFCIEVGK